jgi:hypothetical protein
LKEDRAAQTRGQNEMAFKQRTGGFELGQDVIDRH